MVIAVGVMVAATTYSCPFLAHAQLSQKLHQHNGSKKAGGKIVDKTTGTLV